MTDLISTLRALSRHEHDDLTIGDEAAYEIARLRVDHAVAMAAMDAKIERLRAALAELLACHTESAGWSMSMLTNRAEFDEMIDRNQERLESAVGAARAALKEKP